MAIRWYVIPFNVAPTPNSSGAFDLVHRYFHDPRYNATGMQVSFSGSIYRYEKLWCGWADVTPAQHATISADPQVLAAPTNINNTLTAGAVTTVTSFLEGIKIPSQWISTTNTYRQVLRGIIEFFSIFQMLREALGNKTLIAAGITLETEWQALPAQFRTDALALWQSQGFNTAQLGPTTKIRAVLRGLTTQMATRTFNLSGQIL